MKPSFLRTAAAVATLTIAPQVLALNIVLSNDDGWDAQGIQVMKAALVAGGHAVVLSGSLNGQSGSSAALSFDELEIIKQREFVDQGALEYSVGVAGTSEGAEPATAALVGISIAELVFGGSPDLVVSGINAGQNLGGFTQISGTVGAATAALSKSLGGGTLPAIAISTDEICDPEEEENCDETNGAIYAAAADFVVELIGGLEGDSGLRIPEGVGLNINYPPLEAVAGARVTRQGQTGKFPGIPGSVSLSFGCLADCITSATGVPVPGGINGIPSVEETVRSADTIWNEEGFITLVPIRTDFTVGFGAENRGRDFRFRVRLNRILRSLGY